MAKKVKSKFDSGLLRFYKKVKSLVELQEELKEVSAEKVEEPKVEEAKAESEISVDVLEGETKPLTESKQET